MDMPEPIDPERADPAATERAASEPSVSEPDVSSKPAEPSGRSRRQFLALVGIGALGAGFALGSGIPALVHLTASTPARVPTAAGGSLRVDHVTVVDPRDGSRRDDMSILVRDGRIVAVGSAASLRDVTVASVVDGAGRFAVPGYNNMHTHALQAERPALMMATMLAEGVTGMRQMAGTTEILERRAEQRLPLGPRSPRLLGMPGAILTPFNAGSASDVQHEIDRQFDAGADFIKIVLTERDVFFAAVAHAHRRGLKIAGHLPESVLPSEASAAGFDCIEHFGASNGVWIESSTRSDDLRTATDASLPFPGWVAGLPFVEGIVTAGSSRTLINPAAFDSPEAVERTRNAISTFDDDRARALAETLAANGTWQSPTLVRLRTQYLMDDDAYLTDPWLERMSSDARADYEEVLRTFTALPARTRETHRLVYETALRFTRICHERGVPLLAGTDGQGRAPGQHLRLEFRELAAAGIPPLDILRMTTTAPAQYLGRPATLGIIAPGADADVVLLGSDPLTDAAHLSDVTAVIRDGHHSTAEELRELVDHLTASPEAEGLPFGGVDERFACC